MWYYLHRITIHALNDILRLKTLCIESLPIAFPADVIRAEAEQVVTRLIEIVHPSQEARQLLRDWLRTEFAMQGPGKHLIENFATFEQAAFVDEVRKRRAKSAGKLTPGALRTLQEGYTELVGPIRQERAEAVALERKLNDLANEAYGLTEEEIALLWETAPPRMPLVP